MRNKKVIKNEVYYSQTILDLLSSHMIDNKVLDKLDIQLLKEISIWTKMKVLVELIPLTKSGIEKRRRILRDIFNMKADSDRELILAAKRKRFYLNVFGPVLY